MNTTLGGESIESLKWRPMREGVKISRTVGDVLYCGGQQRPATVLDILKAVRYATNRLGIDPRLIWNEVDALSGELFLHRIRPERRQAVFDGILSVMRTTMKIADLMQDDGGFNNQPAPLIQWVEDEE